MPRPPASAVALAAALAAMLAAAAGAQPVSNLELFSVQSPDLRESGIGGLNSMAVTADLDNDGVPDLALGATQEDAGAGRVYLVSGATGDVIRVVRSPQTVQAERFGDAVVALPDLDGDGLGDLAVGASAATVGGVSGSGRVYTVSARTGAVIGTLASPSPTEGGAFGFALARVPDVDGDGVDDLAVGAPDEDAPDAAGERQRDVGRAYLYSGATGARLQSLVSANPWEESFNGRIRGSDFGWTVSGLADTDGDGRGEVLVGAPGEWSGDFDGPLVYDGRYYAFRPSAGAAAVYASPNAASRGNFGNSVAGAPDLSGDGVPDVLVGAPSEDLSDADDDEGQAYLLSGADGSALRRYVSPEPSDESAFGSSVHVMPDLTSDGVDEVLILEPTTCCDKQDAAYVFDGATGELAYSFEVPYTTFDIKSALGLPDLDGDGRGELALGLSVGLSSDTDLVLVISGDTRRAEIEPNDALGEAQRLRGSSPRVVEGLADGADVGFNGRVTNSNGSIEDLFRIDLVQPGVRVTLEGFSTDLDLYLWLPDLTRVALSGNGGTADELIDLPTLETGTYYIGVDYCGTFSLGDCQEDEGEWTTYTLTVEGALEAAVSAEAPAPPGPALGQPFPNPARERALVEVRLAEPGPARLTVIDLLGRHVATVLDGPLPAGVTPVGVDGAALAPGVYVLRLEAGGRVATRMLTRVR